MASLKTARRRNDRVHPALFILILLAGIPIGLVISDLIVEDAYRLYSVIELARLYMP